MRSSESFPRLTDAMRLKSLRRTMAAAPINSAVWVFGYGSLMWNPCFSYIERRIGTVQGYCRRFCVLSARARGTPRNPGLGLGLEHGGAACSGIVYCLDNGSLGADLKALWNREMTSGIYQPHWLPVETEEGEITAITFVVDTEHPQYAGHLTPHEMAELIVRAEGRYGPCRDYLVNTVRELAILGVSEPEFDVLVAMVDDRAD